MSTRGWKITCGILAGIAVSLGMVAAYQGVRLGRIRADARSEMARTEKAETQQQELADLLAEMGTENVEIHEKPIEEFLSQAARTSGLQAEPSISVKQRDLRNYVETEVSIRQLDADLPRIINYLARIQIERSDYVIKEISRLRPDTKKDGAWKTGYVTLSSCAPSIQGGDS